MVELSKDSVSRDQRRHELQKFVLSLGLLSVVTDSTFAEDMYCVISFN